MGVTWSTDCPPNPVHLLYSPFVWMYHTTKCVVAKHVEDDKLPSSKCRETYNRSTCIYIAQNRIKCFNLIVLSNTGK